jgi:hypothetical protein
MQDFRPVQFSADPAFAIAAGGTLMPSVACSAQDAWRHLTTSVSRNPKDLESHVRRVMLAVRAPLPEHLFGAVLDLYLILGPNGRHLREFLLEQAVPQLDPEDQHFLRHYLAEGLSRDVQLPAAKGSVLDPAAIGAVRLVEKQKAVVAETSALEQAVQLLDDGDLDGARQLLESALLADPADSAIAKELLLIYRHSRDEAAQAAMLARLQEQGAPAPEGWV